MKNMYPLSKTEYGIYMEEMQKPNTTVYNMPIFGILEKTFQ